MRTPAHQLQRHILSQLALDMRVQTQPALSTWAKAVLVSRPRRCRVSCHQWILLFLAAIFLFLGNGKVLAEEIGTGDGLSPPRYQALTSGNVDPKTGEFLLETLDLSVGSGEFPSRLDLVRVQSSVRGTEYKIEGRAVCTTCGGYVGGDGPFPLNLRADLWGGVNIVLLGTTYGFVQNGTGGYDNLKRDGAVLKRSSTNKRLEFTAKNGLKAIFDFVPSFTCGYSAVSGPGNVSTSKSICQRVRYVEMPDGQSISYRYVGRTAPGYTSYTLAHLSEVRNSRGYGIQFAYGDSQNETLVTQATAFRANCVTSSTVNCVAGTLGSVSYQYDRYPIVLGSYFWQLKYFTDANGKRTEYQFDTSSSSPATFYSFTNRLLTVKYPENPTIPAFTNSYGSDGKVASQLDAMSNQTLYNYGASETTITDPLAHVTRYGFSGVSPLPAYVEDANGRRKTFTYDSYFRVTKIEAPEGDSVEMTLDDRNNITTSQRKAKPGSGLADLVSTASFPVCDDTNYRICNKPNYTVDQRGARTDYAYDTAHGGLTVTIAPPDAQGQRPVTRIGYGSFTPAADTAPPAVSDADNIAESTITLPTTLDKCLSSQAGVTTSFVCPAADTVRTSQTYEPSTSGTRSGFELQSATVDPSGLNLATSFTYDRVGNILSEDGPRGDADITTYVYDNTRRVTLRTNPTAGGGTPRTRYTFDDNGRLKKTEASLGVDWAPETIVYDTRGLKIQSTGPDGSPITQSYDIAGRPEETAQTVNGVVRRTRNVLDAVGQVTAIKLAANTPLEQAVMTVTYSPNGRALTQTDASGHVSTFCYDGFDRLIERRYPDPATGTAPTCATVAAGGTLPAGVTRERSIYAANGDLASVTLRDSRTIAFSYDSLGRLTLKDVPETDRDISYSYDLLGQRIAANLPGTNAALSIAWTYDKAGRVLSSTGPYARAVNYAYGTDLTWLDMEWPDSTRVRYSSDALGRVTTITAQTGLSTLATYSYDELSRRTAVAYGNATQTTYGYNTQYRLSSLAHDFAGTAQDATYSFTYNEAGEIVSRSVSNAAFETASPGTVQRIYRPAAGSSATGGNGLNQYGQIDPAPTTLNYDLNGNLTRDADPQRIWDYVYDSENRLVSANDTAFAYDAVGRLAEVRNGSQATRFLYDGMDRIAEYDAVSSALINRTVHGPAVNEPLVADEGGSRTWLFGDERGSIVALANASGVATAINIYGLWGEPGPAVAGRFGFTGQSRLAGTGLYHFHARVYSPMLGRFLQPDPIGEQGGMNLYAYALNDPLNLVDPYGLQGAPFNQLPQINVTAYYMASGWAGSINYAALNSALHTALAIGVPGYAATGSAILSYQQGNYWNAAGYSTIAAAELGLTVVTAGQYAVAAAAARGSIRAGTALASLERRAAESGASNVASAPKLATQLRLESARSPFTSSGQLTPQAIQDSRMIIPNSQIGNSKVPPGYNKYSTPTYQSPSGDFQTHFYMNPKTGKVLYDLDYKNKFN